MKFISVLYFIYFTQYIPRSIISTDNIKIFTRHFAFFVLTVSSKSALYFKYAAHLNSEQTHSSPEWLVALSLAPACLPLLAYPSSLLLSPFPNLLNSSGPQAHPNFFFLNTFTVWFLYSKLNVFQMYNLKTFDKYLHP